jgi:hypothetical protein
MFLALELYSQIGMHTKLYQPLIPSVLMPTLDCIAHNGQTVQLRQQPLWGIDLRAMLGRLQAGHQAHRTVISIVWRFNITVACRMKMKTDIYVGGRRDQNDVQINYIFHT